MGTNFDIFSLVSFVTAIIMLGSIADVLIYHARKGKNPSPFVTKYLIIAGMLSASNFASSIAPDPMGGWHTIALVTELVGVLLLGAFAHVNIRTTARKDKLETENEVLRSELKSAQMAKEAAEGAAGAKAKKVHDLNNSIQSVLGSLRLIGRKSEGDEEIQKLTKLGSTAADKLVEMTKPAPKTRSIYKMVRRIERIIEHAAYPCSVHFDYNDTRSVHCDKQHLELIVLNLVTNARDAMPEGGVISVSTFDCEDGVCLSVEDEGGGMSDDVKERIFEPFFSTKDEPSSKGLGMTLIKGAVKKFGGSVRVDSSEDGTRITVSFGAAQKRRILVVDDDEIVRDAACDMLLQMDHEAVPCASGEEALTELDTHEYDLVILDFAMPTMNGADVASEMKARGHDLPIIFASGFLDKTMMKRACGSACSGEVDIIRKPYGKEELHEAIRKHV